MPGLDYWEQRYDELFPNGLTFEEAEEANNNMWHNAYLTREMAEEDEVPEPILIVGQQQ